MPHLSRRSLGQAMAVGDRVGWSCSLRACRQGSQLTEYLKLQSLSLSVWPSFAQRWRVRNTFELWPCILQFPALVLEAAGALPSARVYRSVSFWIANSGATC
eukprot:CAMPEP_0177216314 /NCGR_PEP_ID=MMETSP0367-20130122/34689_1 /TAXON_ID=447022 ORGANISM="Scrippsiella hangoei-like, Strain SHHI-4" /NCGR_SAMPLE_ID=MMETSP0367 /ASSEMBLY_ACC=CAM_ASM_000362 /LENGTH=101 /DNA_ID=CAMNT_0018665817 /DNA_START=120 /DNA_END=422 /DNA_ORIENTATION=-